MELHKDLVHKIKANRPKLSESSIRTYVSTLTNIYKKLQGEGGIHFFTSHAKEILHSLGEKHSKTRKSVLSALYILTNHEDYRKMMIEDCKIVNDAYKNQTKDAKQTENWVDIKEVKDIYEQLKSVASKMLDKKLSLDSKLIVQFFLIGLLGGVSGLPPRRSMDYSEMKIRNINPKTDNYYKAGKFYFNIYKTKGKYGLQVLEIPAELNKYIKKWIKLNEGDYLLFSSNGNKLSSSQITRILNKVFGKNISTDLLRHIFLSNQYKDIPKLQEMENLAEAMGHNLGTALEYIKH
jgi:hypothetical protein